MHVSSFENGFKDSDDSDSNEFKHTMVVIQGLECMLTALRVVSKLITHPNIFKLN